MKTLKCYDCSESFSANTREEMLNFFYTHYTKNHESIIRGVDDNGKKRWMERFEHDWEHV